jgi:hypothetical protein
LKRFTSEFRTAPAIKESVKYSGSGLKKKNISLPTLLITCLLTTVFLAACGGQPLPTTVSTNTTPGIVKVTGSPGPTLNQASPIQAIPTATALPTPTIVPPTPTAVPTPTIPPTPTIVPTPTIPPTPTPVPIPTSLLLGPQGSEWGQITLYLSKASDRLEGLPLESGLQTDLSSWFQYAPMLIRTSSATNSNYQYVMKIESKLFKDVLNGLPDSNIIGSQVRAGYATNSSNLAQLPLSVAGRLLSPLSILNLIKLISDLLNGANLDQQLDVITNKLDEIKGFLEAKEQAAIQGNFKYLNNLVVSLKQFKPDDEELKTYLAQLETIERESLQSMSLLEGQLKDSAEKVKNSTFDKSFVLFRNENKVNMLKDAVTDFQNKAGSYEAALLVRGLAGEIRCALPFSRDTALTRLADVRQELTNWRDNYQQFFQLVDQKIPQMDGLFADSKTQESLKELSKQGKLNSSNEYNRVDVFFADTIQKVNAQVKEASQPLYIVVELDSQGQLKKVSKLIQ